MSALRAVFLDVDDTMVDFDRAARAALAATLGAGAGYDLSRGAGLRAVWLDRRGVSGGRQSSVEVGVAVINGSVQLAELVA